MMDIIVFIEDQRKTKVVRSKLKREFPAEYQYIIEHSQFIPTSFPFLSNMYCVYHNITSHPVCPVCSVKLKWHRLWGKGFGLYCSTRCKNLDTAQQDLCKAGMLKKYGVSNPSNVAAFVEKRATTNMERYGTAHPSQLSHFKEKTITTNMERYGASHAQKTAHTREKTKQTNIERYGVEYIQQHAGSKELSKQTSQRRYDVGHPTQKHMADAAKLLNDKTWLMDQHITQHKSLLCIAKELGVWDTTVKRYLNTHDIPLQTSNVSSGEHELQQFLHTRGVKFESNCRTIIPPQEVDIFIPDANIAIEFNGLYWHSTKFKHKSYHQEKTAKCHDLGIRLIHIFEDDWNKNSNIIKNTLLHLLHLSSTRTVYGRNTSVAGATPQETRDFLNKHHIQGAGGGSVRYGLYDDTHDMVACAVFIRQSTGVFVLNRYATSCTVPGGFSKLLKHFELHNNHTHIITFADKTWSNGELYLKTGFVVDKVLPPDYKYVVNGKRIHKFNYRHKNLPRLLDHYDPTISETDNCRANFIDMVYDCGKIRFIKTHKKCRKIPVVPVDK